MDDVKDITLTTDRASVRLVGKIRQSNWAVIIEVDEGDEKGEMWVNKHFIRQILITDYNDDDD